MEVPGVTGKIEVIKIQFQQMVALKGIIQTYQMDNITNGDGDSEQLSQI